MPRHDIATKYEVVHLTKMMRIQSLHLESRPKGLEFDQLGANLQHWYGQRKDYLQSRLNVASWDFRCDFENSTRKNRNFDRER